MISTSTSCLGCGIDVPTPAGLNVQIDPVDQSGDGLGVSLIFSEVLSAGITTVSTLPTNSVNLFGVALSSLGNFNITTTASFSGEVLVRFKMPLSVSSEFPDLRVTHTKNGVTEDITIFASPYDPDFETRTIYGRTFSFSMFAVAPDPTGVCCYANAAREPRCESANMTQSRCSAANLPSTSGHVFTNSASVSTPACYDPATSPNGFKCCGELSMTDPNIKRCDTNCFIEADRVKKTFDVQDCRWECDKTGCGLNKWYIEPRPGAACECKCTGMECGNRGQVWKDDPANPTGDCLCECGGPCGDGKVLKDDPFWSGLCVCVCDDSEATSVAKCGDPQITHKTWQSDGGECSCKCESGWTKCPADNDKCMPSGCGKESVVGVDSNGQVIRRVLTGTTNDCLCRCIEEPPSGKRKRFPEHWSGQSYVPSCDFVCDENNLDRDAYCECLKGPNYCTAPKILKDTTSGCKCVCPELTAEQLADCQRIQGIWINPETCECECLISDAEICGGKCYPKCPTGQTRNQQSCQCECNNATFNDATVFPVSKLPGESGKCMYEISCWLCNGDGPERRTANRTAKQISDRPACSNYNSNYYKSAEAALNSSNADCLYPCVDRGLEAGKCLDKYYVKTQERFKSASQNCPSVCRDSADCDCEPPTTEPPTTEPPTTEPPTTEPPTTEPPTTEPPTTEPPTTEPPTTEPPTTEPPTTNSSSSSSTCTDVGCVAYVCGNACSNEVVISAKQTGYPTRDDCLCACLLDDEACCRANSKNCPSSSSSSRASCEGTKQCGSWERSRPPGEDFTTCVRICCDYDSSCACIDGSTQPEFSPDESLCPEEGCTNPSNAPCGTGFRDVGGGLCCPNGTDYQFPADSNPVCNSILCGWECRSNRWTLVYDGCSGNECQGDCINPGVSGSCVGETEWQTASTGCDSGGRPRQCC